jgi:hypothetical protein
MKVNLVVVVYIQYSLSNNVKFRYNSDSGTPQAAIPVTAESHKQNPPNCDQKIQF